MDETAAPKPADQRPTVPSPPPKKHHMPTWLKIICWTVAIGVGGVVAYFTYAVIVVILAITTIGSRCTASQDKATTASEQYANTLNNLGIIPEPYNKAQPNPSGDCIDTASHTADATLTKIYSTPQPLMTLSQQIKTALVAKGYSLKTDLTLVPIQTPTDPVDVYAEYSKAGLPVLTVTYIVGHNPNICDSASQDAYSTCISQYEDSFKNLAIQVVSEVDLDMSKDFPNNY